MLLWSKALGRLDWFEKLDIAACGYALLCYQETGTECART